MDLHPIWLSLQLALITTALLFVLGLPLAWWLARSRGRGKVLIEVLLSLPIVLPPTVLGFYLLLAFSPQSSLGGFFAHTLNSPLAFSFSGMVLASLIYNLPFMIFPLRAGLASLPPSYAESAALLGKKPWQILWQVQLPNIRPQLAAALALTFAHTLGEFGVLVMISGNIPGETRVASVAVWEEMETGNLAAAHSYAALLLGISFVSLLIIMWWNRREGRVI